MIYLKMYVAAHNVIAMLNFCSITQGSEVGLELVRILTSLGSQLHHSIALASVS